MHFVSLIVENNPSIFSTSRMTQMPLLWMPGQNIDRLNSCFGREIPTENSWKSKIRFRFLLRKIRSMKDICRMVLSNCEKRIQILEINSSIKKWKYLKYVSGRQCVCVVASLCRADRSLNKYFLIMTKLFDCLVNS